MEGKRGSECLLKPVSNIDFNPKQLEHQKATFKELLHDLPPIQLKALTMQDRDKRTQKDIALTLGVEYRTVVNWKEKFNRQLRKRLWQTN